MLIVRRRPITVSENRKNHSCRRRRDDWMARHYLRLPWNRRSDNCRPIDQFWLCQLRIEIAQRKKAKGLNAMRVELCSISSRHFLNTANHINQHFCNHANSGSNRGNRCRRRKKRNWKINAKKNKKSFFSLRYGCLTVICFCHCFSCLSLIVGARHLRFFFFNFIFLLFFRSDDKKLNGQNIECAARAATFAHALKSAKQRNIFVIF